jgi:hypothetical protein
MKTTPLRTSSLRSALVALVLAGAALVSAEWDRRQQVDASLALAAYDGPGHEPASHRHRGQ